MALGVPTVVAAELYANDERRGGQFSLDGVDDVENEACAVLNRTTVLERAVSKLEEYIWWFR